jgi:hypothetical protein
MKDILRNKVLWQYDIVYKSSMRWAEHVAHTLLIGNHDVKRQFEKNKIRCQVNSKMDLKEIWYKGAGWSKPAHNMV